jgi:hypothetical protein
LFKQIIALMMVLSVFSVQADVSSQNGLKAAFDELNYSLTVVWDQQDQEFHADQIKNFTATIRELQNAGLTSAELINFAKAELKDAQAAKDLEIALNVIQINNMSPAEANKYIVDTMKKTYSTGASWNGNVIAGVVVGVMIVAIAILIASSSNQSSSSGSTGGGYTCNYNTPVCESPCYNTYPSKRVCEVDCYKASNCY